MFLLGWEMFKGQPRVFTITPLRTGRVTYVVGLIEKSRIDTIVPFWISMRQYFKDNMQEEWFRQNSFSIAMNRFAYNDIAQFLQDWSSSAYYGLILVPVTWEDLPSEPAALVSDIHEARVMSFGNPVGIWGAAPSWVLPTFPSSIKLRPGDRFSLKGNLGVKGAGATLGARIENIATGKVATLTQGMNVGDSLNLEYGDEMPALLPDETASVQGNYGYEVLDIDSVLRGDSAKQELRRKLEGTLLPRQTSTRLDPTDAILVDTKGGVAQVLGDDLSYEGVVIAEGAPPVVKGTSPTRHEWKNLQYLRLSFSRPIALCENRRLVNSSTSLYEFSTVPTPLTLLQSLSFLAVNYRPAFPWEGPPVPKVMMGPALRVRVA